MEYKKSHCNVCLLCLQGDNLLSDLPTCITLEEVNSLIALEHGQAITVNIRRADNTVLSEFVSEVVMILIVMSIFIIMIIIIIDINVIVIG